MHKIPKFHYEYISQNSLQINFKFYFYYFEYKTINYLKLGM